jgi:hypothetical protein
MKKISKAAKPKLILCKSGGKKVVKPRILTDDEKVEAAEIIEICEQPGFLDHLQGKQFRVTLEGFDSERNAWVKITQDEGSEVWLLQYPPISTMAHYCLQGAKYTPPPAPPEVTDDDIPF